MTWSSPRVNISIGFSVYQIDYAHSAHQIDAERAISSPPNKIRAVEAVLCLSVQRVRVRQKTKETFTPAQGVPFRFTHQRDHRSPFVSVGLADSISRQDLLVIFTLGEYRFHPG